MSSRVTDLDKALADKIKTLRLDAKMTQPDVAGYLGITYQSYQKMETGKVAFRASTLERISSLYGLKLRDLFQDHEHSVDPVISRANLMFNSLNPDDRERAIEYILRLKHEES